MQLEEADIRGRKHVANGAQHCLSSRTWTGRERNTQPSSWAHPMYTLTLPNPTLPTCGFPSLPLHPFGFVLDDLGQAYPSTRHEQMGTRSKVESGTPVSDMSTMGLGPTSALSHMHAPAGGCTPTHVRGGGCQPVRPTPVHALPCILLAVPTCLPVVTVNRQS